MPLTRDFKETIQARAERDPAFREELLREGVELLLSGDMDTGKAVLRDYINATIGFRELGELTEKSPKSLMRMFGPAGNPQARNLFEIIGCLKKQEGFHGATTMTKPVPDPLQLHECLWSYLDQLNPPSNNRARLVGAAFRFIVDCHEAFSLLTHKGLHGPTFALVRSMLEGLQRGYWLYYCAPDDTINNLNDTIADIVECDPSRVIQGIDNHLFSTNIIKDIENNRHFKQGLLASFKNFILDQKTEENRNAMHSYTHVGYLMLRDYISEEAIESNFDPKTTHEVLRLANHCACWAVIGAARATQNNSMAEKIFRISKSLS